MSDDGPTPGYLVMAHCIRPGDVLHGMRVWLVEPDGNEVVIHMEGSQARFGLMEMIRLDWRFAL